MTSPWTPLARVCRHVWLPTRVTFATRPARRHGAARGGRGWSDDLDGCSSDRSGTTRAQDGAVMRYTALGAILLIGLMSGCASGGPTTNDATVVFRYSHFDPAT